MSRTPVIAGNWKMFKTVEESVRFFDEFKPLVASADHCEIVLCPPATSLTAAVETVRGSNVRVGSQNVHWEEKGAYTGEISPGMLTSAGVTHAIIGHSERRQYFAETDETVAQRTVAALAAGLTPIVCVGETLEERESGRTEDVLATQFSGGLGALSAEQMEKLVVAYEPVWAIGTGKTATPETAEAAHEFLRGQARAKFGDATADGLRILYGGSVKPANVQGLMACENIDGGLVGGASLEPASFAAIVNYNQG